MTSPQSIAVPSAEAQRRGKARLSVLAPLPPRSGPAKTSISRCHSAAQSSEGIPIRTIAACADNACGNASCGHALISSGVDTRGGHWV